MLVDEAVSISSERGCVDRILALGMRARVVLAQQGQTGASAITEALDAAERIVVESGAAVFAPHLLVERAALAAACGDTAQRDQSLREALRGFESVGAQGHARCLDLQLGG